MAPRPSVKAVLICDQIIQEAMTNKKSLIGIFEDVHVTQFPCRYPRIAVYANLTDARGSYSIEVRLIGAQDGAEVGRARTPPVTIESPLQTCEFALQIQNLVFQKPGLYEFQIHANDELLATKSFHVKLAKQRPPDQSFPPG
ncbi:MAG: DUF6941 family protein [Planctomycetaceae bacterium]